jgi:AraC family ethanolamine operon transcriptional activator
MRSFDDFDAWGEAVNGASLRMACDSMETRHWSLGIFGLGDVVLQMAFEGGGNICYGGNTHVGTQLFIPLSHSAAHVCNGEPLDDASMLVIPRGADFRIRIRRHAHSWCSIALPFEATQPASWIARGIERVSELKRLAQTIATNLTGCPADTAAHRTAGRHLATLAATCLVDPVEPRAALGRPRLDRAAIIRSAMDRIDAAAIMPSATDLAQDLGLTSRTLLRAFQESFGVSPKRYLLLRELHVVRRELRSGAREDATVTDVLTRHGIWELGRFAARYRRQFGELPSATLRQARS